MPERTSAGECGQAQRTPASGSAGLPSAPTQAPELINGRLAMLGFVAAVGAEIASHENILQQFRSRPVPILLTVAAFSLATLIPIVRGTDYKPFGFFTPGAEIWNGRVAALGLALMILIEACYGTAIFG